MLARNGHRSIQVQGHIFHIGGRDLMPFERWTLQSGEISTREVSKSVLTEYDLYPETFLVDSQFCTMH